MSDNPKQPAMPIRKGNWSGAGIYPGMTKREYIAAMVLQGLISNSAEHRTTNLPSTAVRYADTLLKELEK